MNRPVLAISIGDAPDLEKLGFPNREVRRVLFALCTAFIKNGFSISYAGDLREGGFTHAMFEFLAGTYAGQGIVPFHYVVPATVSSGRKFSDALALARETRSIAAIHLVRGSEAFELRNSEDRLLVGPKGPSRLTVANEAEWEEFLQAHPSENVSEALTDARRFVAEISVGCVSMGGKMGLVDLPSDQYHGDLPGVAEEALMFIQACKPYIPLGAFGGATRDIAIALSLLAEGDRSPRGEQLAGYNVAMARIRAIGSGISAELRSHLEAVVKEENAEEAAQLALGIIQRSLASSEGTQPDR